MNWREYYWQCFKRSWSGPFGTAEKVEIALAVACGAVASIWPNLRDELAIALWVIPLIVLVGTFFIAWTFAPYAMHKEQENRNAASLAAAKAEKESAERALADLRASLADQRNPVVFNGTRSARNIYRVVVENTSARSVKAKVYIRVAEPNGLPLPFVLRRTDDPGHEFTSMPPKSGVTFDVFEHIPEMQATEFSGKPILFFSRPATFEFLGINETHTEPAGSMSLIIAIAVEGINEEPFTRFTIRTEPHEDYLAIVFMGD